MMNLSTITEMTKEIAFQLRAEAGENQVTHDDLMREIDSQFIADGVHFTCEAARMTVTSIIQAQLKYVDAGLHNAIFGACYMDENGSYTHNPDRWA